MNSPGYKKTGRKPDSGQPGRLSRELRANIDTIVTDFGDSSDLVVNVDADDKSGITFAVVFLSEMVSNSRRVAVARV
jgi:hypothetical protein